MAPVDEEAECDGRQRRRHWLSSIAQVGTQPLRLKVPPVEPGDYRIVQEVTQARPVIRDRVVLYGRLRVVPDP